MPSPTFTLMALIAGFIANFCAVGPKAEQRSVIPRICARRRWLPLAFLLGAAIAHGQQDHPLRPADRSSPRAAIQTFLASGDAFGEFVAHDYLPSPSPSRYDHLIVLADKTIQSLDLSEIPSAARKKEGYTAAWDLYDVRSRIPLPPLDQIPDAEQVKVPGNPDTERWVVPDTEIVLVRAKTGSRRGDFVFSAESVSRANEFYERTRGLPYARSLPMKDLHYLAATAGGWMIPYAWIQALPASLRAPIAGQSGWKWMGLACILGLLALFLAMTHRLTQVGAHRRPLARALARLAMPIALLLAMVPVEHLALVQLVLTGSVGGAAEDAATAAIFIALAWLAWRLAPVVAETIIASRRFGPEGLDSHIIRAGARLVSIGVATAILALGADRVGMPLYGIVAGLGVGGLAVALAIQPTIENLIAGINLIADNALRIGEDCKYGDDMVGTVEAIGIRSTRVRGIDHKLTNIPNAVLAKMPIVSLTRRERMLIRTVLRLRCETTPEQLRQVVAKLRHLLTTDPRVDPGSAYAFLVKFGDSSLDIELSVHVRTADSVEFFVVQEEILFRVMDILEQVGTALAFPSQTLYLGRDRGIG